MTRDEKKIICMVANGLISSLSCAEDFIKDELAEIIDNDPDTPCGIIMMQSMRNDMQTLVYMYPLLKLIDDNDLPAKMHVEFIDDNRIRFQKILSDVLDKDIVFDDKIDDDLLKVK